MFESFEWRSAFASADLSVYDPAFGMFGWGQPAQRASGVELPLRARAWVVEHAPTRRRAAYVCCDLLCVTESIRGAVVQALCDEALGISEHDLMLTATHTHSGPSGYSSYLFYALGAPGVAFGVHDSIVRAIVAAIRSAVAALEPARLWVHRGWVPASEPVAFNRSVDAFNRNLDVSPCARERRDEAVDRSMTVLRVDSVAGRPLGLLSWFAVHGTSVHSEFRRLHGDNKGEAAQQVERWASDGGQRGFVAIFAQAAAGDVTPNYRWSAARRCMVGRYADDLESAAFNGAIQARYARLLWADARAEGRELVDGLDGAIWYRDVIGLEASPRFATEAGAKTVSPELGLTFVGGTAEGVGPLGPVRSWLPSLAAARSRVVLRARERLSPRGNKIVVCELGVGASNRALGLRPEVAMAPLLEPRIATAFRRALERPDFRDATWVPCRLPVQQLRVGALVIGALPNEPTTAAGRRMRSAIRDVWARRGVEHVVINGYANAYCGYAATPEEYDLQRYEGASTLFGRYTVPVFCTVLRAQAESMVAGDAASKRGAMPSTPSLDAYRFFAGHRSS